MPTFELSCHTENRPASPVSKAVLFDVTLVSDTYCIRRYLYRSIRPRFFGRIVCLSSRWWCFGNPNGREYRGSRNWRFRSQNIAACLAIIQRTYGRFDFRWQCLAESHEPPSLISNELDRQISIPYRPHPITCQRGTRIGFVISAPMRSQTARRFAPRFDARSSLGRAASCHRPRLINVIYNACEWRDRWTFDSALFGLVLIRIYTLYVTSEMV